MNSQKPSRYRPLTLIALFAAVIASAQIYKWVDETGQVHYGDQPPTGQKLEEVELPSGPSQAEVDKAKEELRESLELRQQRDAATQKKDLELKHQKQRETFEETSSFRICAMAIQQHLMLKEQVVAFTLNSDWSRTYLSDENRSAEISEFIRLQKTHCKTDTNKMKQQMAAAHRLHRALIITCTNPREELATRSLDPEKKNDYEKYLRLNCPPIDPRGYWIADWIR